MSASNTKSKTMTQVINAESTQAKLISCLFGSAGLGMPQPVVELKVHTHRTENALQSVETNTTWQRILLEIGKWRGSTTYENYRDSKICSLLHFCHNGAQKTSIARVPGSLIWRNW